jgi:hypothetical protein
MFNGFLLLAFGAALSVSMARTLLGLALAAMGRARR